MLQNKPAFIKIVLSICVLTALVIITVFGVKYLIDANATLLTINSDESAEVYLNDKKIGNTPLVIRLKKGGYNVNVKSGKNSLGQKVVLKEKEKSIIYFNFKEFSGPEREKKLSEINHLVIDNSHFTIDLSENDNFEITISLKAIFNAGVNGPPIEEQKAKYLRELKIYKQEVLKWLRDQGVNPDELKIEWIPPEAADI